MQRANEVYQQLFAEFKSRQQQYYEETEHGINTLQQQKWYDNIYQALTDLPEYEE